MTKAFIVKYRGTILTTCLLLLMAPLTVAQLTSSADASGAVPQLVKFGGVLKDDAGHIKTGMVGITFALYKEQYDGAPLWLETQNVVADGEGNYSVLLGSTKTEGMPTDLFSTSEPRWLGVQVEGQAEQPRILFVSVPYALRASDAATIGGLPPSAFLRAPEPGTSRQNSSSNTSTSGTAIPPATAAAEQANEITCASGTGCKAAFVPLFISNGGSAKVSDSIMTQTGSSVNVGGEVVGQTGFFRSSNNGNIFQATQTSTGAGVALAGVAEGTSGIGVAGTGVTGVSGFGLSDGTGVRGQGGTGVFGFSSPTSGFARATVGVLNTNTAGSAGVYGIAQNFSGQTFGVQGYNFSNTNFAAGVSGVADGDQNKTFGVTGVSLSPNGTGVWGLGQGQSVTGGIIGCCSIGMWGDTSSNAPFAAGVVGSADDAQGVVALNNSTNNAHPTAKILNFENTTHDVAVLFASGSFGSCTSDTDGNLGCTGAITPFVTVPGARQVALYSMASPQNWFEDFGSGHLESGVGTIAFEPTFAQIVNTGSDYHVFLTPEGECRGLYISNKSATGFEVHELGGGQSNVAFSYRIVALRRGYENVRLEDKTAMMATMKDNMPKPSAIPAKQWTPPVRPQPFTASAMPQNQAVVAPSKSAPGSSLH